MRELYSKAEAVIRQRIFVSVYEEPSVGFLGDGPASEAKSNRLDVSEVILALKAVIQNQQTEIGHYKEMEESFKEIAKEDYAIHWYRSSKREILKRFFKDLIAELPYYAGGDKKFEEGVL